MKKPKPNEPQPYQPREVTEEEAFAYIMATTLPEDQKRRYRKGKKGQK